jgi:predicted amidohydrolase
MAAARVNRIAIACCDRAGTERGQEWTSATTIISVDGWPVATSGPDQMATADVDLAATRDKRLTDLADALGDRRVDLYASTIGGVAS